jgi:hypothetical protein
MLGFAYLMPDCWIEVRSNIKNVALCGPPNVELNFAGMQPL